jgi:DNA-binding transcriptional regulator YhcF (GntR family)
VAWYLECVSARRPRSNHVYEVLSGRIVTGELPPGAQLPSHLKLAAEFGVAPMTIREVLRRLEDEGLVSRQHGRGTFVRDRRGPSILIVDDEQYMLELLADLVRAADCTPVLADGPASAIAQLESDATIGLVLADIRMPIAEAGTGLIREVRRRWPTLPIAAVTAYPDDLTALHGTPDWPVLVVTKPFKAHQIAEALALALGRRRAAPEPRLT